MKMSKTKSVSRITPSNGSKKEQHAAYESLIMEGLASFIEVGDALKWIHDSQTYKSVDGYKSFEEYVVDKWKMARRTAYQFIRAAEAAANVRDCAQVDPSNECQVRPMTSLKPEEQRECWQAAVEKADGAPTGALVKEVVEELMARTRKAGKENAPGSTASVLARRVSRRVRPLGEFLSDMKRHGEALSTSEKGAECISELEQLHRLLGELLETEWADVALSIKQGLPRAA